MGKQSGIFSDVWFRVVLFILAMGLIWAGAYRLRSFQKVQANMPAEVDALAELPAVTQLVDQQAEVKLSPHLNRTRSEGVQRLALLDTSIPDRERSGIITYTVQTGDNLFAIADMYGLKPETILWGNYDVLKDNPQFLKPKQVLNILPTNGVLYEWKQGDTLSGVAGQFKVEAEAILDWPGNQIDLTEVQEGSFSLGSGAQLIVPGGKRELRDWGPPAISRKNPAAAAYYGSGYCGQVYEGAIGIGAFIWPTVSRSISGYDYDPNIHAGIDIAGPEGNSVFAADSGVVVFSGWSEYGYGYMIVIDHGNGWQSAYAHLSAVGVGCGQSVGRGNTIGAVGNTGNSTGAHLHFELRSEIYGKVNPWDFVSP
jgi:murein DD-endopeptidase MepM/ murein hydrolase activator NlpD